MINVIIPAFNAHETIEKAIYSIAIQTISNLIEIILIDDCSDKDYIDIIKKFENIIKIRYIRNKKNLGIGITRQIAIDNVNQKYFAFLDSDDIYIDAMAFEKMLFCLENNKKNVACFSLFKEEIKGFQKYLQRELTIQWVFSKLYKTSFIKENNIKIPPINSNEDLSFNLQILLYTKKEEKIETLNEDLYLWKFNKNSITRKNNAEYWYHQDIIGALQGFYYINLKNIHKTNLYYKLILDYFLAGIVRYLESKKERYKEKWFKEIFKELKIFYKKIILPEKINLNKNWIEKNISLIAYPNQKKYFTIEEVINVIDEITMN